MRFILRSICAASVIFGLAAPAFAGAWTVRNDWNGRVRPGDPDSPTYAEAFPAYARATSAAWEAQGVRLDCADFSMSLLIAYAKDNGLPASFRFWHAAQARYVTAASTERRFTSHAQYDRYIREAINAQNLTGNTRAVRYDEWATGDVVLMNWNQTEVEPNFPGRDVWHTFLIGEPGVSVYYGNLDAEQQPMPVVSSTEQRRIDQITIHPDRYGLSPRRFNVLTYRAGWNVPERAIEARSGTVYVTASGGLNVRRGPGSGRHAFMLAPRAAALEVTGKYRDWLRVRTGGQEGWVSSLYVGETRPDAGSGPGTGSGATQGQAGRVTASRLNVRTGPGLAYPAVMSLARGAQVRVLGRSGEFYRIAIPGRPVEPARWASAAYIALE